MAKVLLVEDDNNLREIYEARLQAEGYEIVTAPDGETALVVAKKELPDLVISDVMMPRVSGFEMLDILRNTEGLKHVRVIMLTALGQAEDKTRADSLGADKYLVKSQVTLEDIVNAASELLGGETPDGPAPEAASATVAPTGTPAPAPALSAAPLAPAAAAPTEPAPVPSALFATAAPTQPAAPVSAPATQPPGLVFATPTPAPAPAAPAPTVAVPPTPVPVPAPEPAVIPEPPQVAAPAADPVAMAAPAAAPPPVPAATPIATPPPAAPAAASTTPTPTEGSTPDGQVVANAVQNLINGTPEANNANPTAPAAPASAQAATPADEDEDARTKKIIQPLDSNSMPAPTDLNQLMTQEGHVAVDPSAPQESALPHQPGSVISPNAPRPVDQAGDLTSGFSKEDHNKIAL